MRTATITVLAVWKAEHPKTPPPPVFNPVLAWMNFWLPVK